MNLLLALLPLVVLSPLASTRLSIFLASFLFNSVIQGLHPAPSEVRQKEQWTNGKHNMDSGNQEEMKTYAEWETTDWSEASHFLNFQSKNSTNTC